MEEVANMASLVFNGTGLIISISAVVVIAHTAVSLTGVVRKKLLSLFKGFVFIILSFIWSLFFNFLLKPSLMLSIQSVLLAFGMAMLIYSANKLIEIHEREKIKLESTNHEV